MRKGGTHRHMRSGDPEAVQHSCICETGSGALDALSGAAASLLGVMLLGVGWLVHRKTA